MQKLDSPFHFDDAAKTFYLSVVPDIADLPGDINPESKYFGMLLAMDATDVPDAAIISVASKLIQRGLAYICCWGPGCERVHDVFDQAELGLDLVGYRDSDDTSIIMSTWHDKEPLHDAAFFFAASAWPSSKYQGNCKDWIAANIANPEWESILRSEIKNGFPLRQ